MIGSYITEGICRLMSYDDKVKQVAMDSFWLLHTKQDNGAGSAVLLAPNLAVTSAHNFNSCKPKKSRLISPRTGKSIDIKSAIINKDDDLAILTLSQNTKELSAKVDFETQTKTGLPVIKGRLTSFDPKVGKLETVQGIIVAEEINDLIVNEEDAPTSMRTLFHLRSKRGDSGAGIFSQEGKLLTINNTGNGRFGVSGTSISRFRKIMRNSLLS